MKCKVIDSRDKKEYVGVLRTGIQIGMPAIVALADGKHELNVVNVKGWLHGSGNKYYVIDGNGIRFTFIFQ
jgi:hypothetical protein